MRISLLSDIHANLSALKAVIHDSEKNYNPEGYAFLGDIINYGTRPNEVIEEIRNLKKPILCNLYGNHEYELFNNNLERFASERGRNVMKWTKKMLNKDSYTYIKNNMVKSGYSSQTIDSKKLFFIHGNIRDPYWGAITDAEISNEQYSEYDYVISGHTHIPNYIEHYINNGNKLLIKKKKTIFINPGSVGQPRNHNNKAHYSFIDTKSGIYHLNTVAYDIRYEMSLYDSINTIDKYYSYRLELGI